MDYRANILFLGFFVVGNLFFLFSKQTIYFRITLSGFAILLNALITFKILQISEIILFQYKTEKILNIEDAKVSNWSFDKSNRIISNTSIPLYAKLPKNLFFHNPKNLKMENRSGIGKLIGVFSIGDERNPNLYPYIRLFLVSEKFKLSPGSLIVEFNTYLELLKNQGKITEVKELGPHIHPTKNWEGHFWTFYDKLRPRYSKIGFYVMNTQDDTLIIIEIMDNLTKNRFHTKLIESVLDSLTQSIHL